MCYRDSLENHDLFEFHPPLFTAVRVNCKTPDIMIFQIYEPKVRALLGVPHGRRFMLFSEDPQSLRPIPTCSANHTITDESPGWSRSFTFLSYSQASSCIVRSFLLDRESSSHHTYVADIYVKVLASDDGEGIGRRGKIRLTCTVLEAQKVITSDVNLYVDFFHCSLTTAGNQTF